MNAVIPFQPSMLPQAAVQRLASGQSIAKHMADGVGNPVDILSIKGKNFTERVNGETVPTQRPMYEFDVVILDATPNLTKKYYEGQYVEGSMEPPDCWSLNGIKPDPGAPKKQSTTCRGCKWNVFGSRVSDRPGQPSKAKACADSRRVAVFASYKLGYDLPPLMLNVPATSLRPLKEYAEALEKNHVPVNAIVTRMGFAMEAHPQLTFAAIRPLNDQEYAQIAFLTREEVVDGVTRYADDRMQRILDAPIQEEEVDLSELAGTTVITNRTQAPPVQPQATAPSPQWTPPGQQQPTMPPQPTAQQPVYTPPVEPSATPDVIIALPDGSQFNQTKGIMIPAPAPVVPQDEIIVLPDGRRFNKTKGAFEAGGVIAQPAQAIPTPPVAAPVAPTPVAAGPTPATPAAGAPVWTPVTNGGAPAPGQQWTPVNPQAGNPPPNGTPEFLLKDPSVHQGPTMDATAVDVTGQQEAPQAPKRRKATPTPPTDVQQAPGNLDALLSSLSPAQ